MCISKGERCVCVRVSFFWLCVREFLLVCLIFFFFGGGWGVWGVDVCKYTNSCGASHIRTQRASPEAGIICPSTAQAGAFLTELVVRHTMPPKSRKTKQL